MRLLSAWVLAIALLGAAPEGRARDRTGEKTYGLVFRVSGHHGCSRSYATLALDGQAALSLRGHRATLVLNYVSDNRIGAQGWQYGPTGLPGRRDGPIRVSQTRERRRFTWLGAVRRATGGVLTMTLALGSEACERLPAHGLTGGVKTSCRGGGALVLTCRPAAIHARVRTGSGTPPPARGGPARPSAASSAGVSARPGPAPLPLVPALQCTAAPWPGQLGLLTHGGSLYLAPGAPLRLTKRQHPGWMESFSVTWER